MGLPLLLPAAALVRLGWAGVNGDLASGPTPVENWRGY